MNVIIKKIACIDPQERRRDEIYAVAAGANGVSDSSPLFRLGAGESWVREASEDELLLLSGDAQDVIVSFLERDMFRDSGRMESFLGKALDLVKDLALEVTPDLADPLVKYIFEAVKGLMGDEIIGTVVIPKNKRGAIETTLVAPAGSRFSWTYKVVLEVTD